MTINHSDRSFRLKRGWLWCGGAVAALALLLAVAWEVECERVVTPQQLPASARTFLVTHYPDEMPVLVIRELDDLCITYKATFRDGTQVEFRRSGRWYKIDSRMRPVPASVVPPRIAEFLAQNYPEMPVTEFGYKRRHYEVELADGSIELKFDDAFALRGYDD